MRVLKGRGFQVKSLCKAAKVSRDAYYKGLSRKRRKERDEGKVLTIVQSIRAYEPRIGVRKLQDRLKKLHYSVGRDWLFSLLRKHRMLVPPPKKAYHKTTYSRHQYVVAPNVLKQSVITAPKQALVSDITYLWVKGTKPVYLFLVSDLYSRKILGYHVSKDMTHYSALLALDRAVHTMGDVTGTIHHSDRGSQYCCHEYTKYLRSKTMIASMTDESHCYQNAIAERINGILKIDLALDQIFESFQSLKSAVKQAIKVYNSIRTHWSLNLKTPDQVYSAAA